MYAKQNANLIPLDPTIYTWNHQTRSTIIPHTPPIMTSTNDLKTIEALQRDLEKLRKEVEDLRRENEELRSGNEDLKTRLAGSKRGLKEEYDRGYSEAWVGTTPRYITEGSFGKISALPMQPTVYKTTILGDRANGEKLQHEFRM
jgi:hypothetical protein